MLGDYSLTLVDSMDTLFVMGEVDRFERAVRDVLQHVSFDRDGSLLKINNIKYIFRLF